MRNINSPPFLIAAIWIQFEETMEKIILEKYAEHKPLHCLIAAICDPV